MKDYLQKINSLAVEIQCLKKEFKAASKFTQKFLKECGNKGITAVSIGKKSSKVPASEGFSFSASGSVFQAPSGTKDETGWPAIWGVVNELKIGGGCGNSDQYQIAYNSQLVEGVYELKGNTWKKVE